MNAIKYFPSIFIDGSLGDKMNFLPSKPLLITLITEIATAHFHRYYEFYSNHVNNAYSQVKDYWIVKKVANISQYLHLDRVGKQSIMILIASIRLYGILAIGGQFIKEIFDLSKSILTVFLVIKIFPICLSEVVKMGNDSIYSKLGFPKLQPFEENVTSLSLLYQRIAAFPKKINVGENVFSLEWHVIKHFTVLLALIRQILLFSFNFRFPLRQDYKMISVLHLYRMYQLSPIYNPPNENIVTLTYEKYAKNIVKIFKYELLLFPKKALHDCSICLEKHEFSFLPCQHTACGSCTVEIFKNKMKAMDFFNLKAFREKSKIHLLCLADNQMLSFCPFNCGASFDKSKLSIGIKHKDNYLKSDIEFIDYQVGSEITLKISNMQTAEDGLVIAFGTIGDQIEVMFIGVDKQLAEDLIFQATEFNAKIQKKEIINNRLYLNCTSDSLPKAVSLEHQNNFVN